MQKRTIYLQQKWQKYPLMDQRAEVFGSVEGIELEKDNFLLKVGDKIVEGSLSGLPAESLAILEILQPGDLVATWERLHIQLLAPKLNGFHEADLASLKTQALFKDFIREFFSLRQFTEADTPFLLECPGTEPTLDPFPLTIHRGSEKILRYLPTSPEISLKKWIATGEIRLFEMKTCFRDGEFSSCHWPEFIMLEWYRAYADLNQIQTDVVDLIHHLLERKSAEFPRNDKPIETLRFSVAELFAKYLQISITPETSIDVYLQGLEKAGIDARGELSIDDAFCLLFSHCIEPQFPARKLIFVESYPPFQAAYSRLNQEGWADRFEVYWQGFELANAFQEVNDPEEQRRRMIHDNHRKQKAGKQPVPLDEEFLAAMGFGFPPTAGIALGVRRLMMAIEKEMACASSAAIGGR